MKQAGISPEIYQAITSVVDERMKLLAIGKEEFGELKGIVKEIAEAQKKTEERLTKLEITVQKLIEAQKKSEKRLTKLEITVQKLIEAQKKTEQRVNELTVAQKKTEQRVNELTFSLIKTEKILQELIISHKELKDSHEDLKKQVGGISHTIGYRLEDEAIKNLPPLLEADFGIKIRGKLKRDFIELPSGRELEVNIIGKGKRDGKEIVIVGESKAQLGKKDIKIFKRKIEKFLIPILGKNIFPVIITYSATPAVVKTAEDEKIKVYFSYEL